MFIIPSHVHSKLSLFLQGDHLKRYGWLKHDGVNFGHQEIVDTDIMLTTSFVKRAGGDFGGDWTANITASSLIKVDTCAY